MKIYFRGGYFFIFGHGRKGGSLRFCSQGGQLENLSKAPLEKQDLTFKGMFLKHIPCATIFFRKPPQFETKPSRLRAGDHLLIGSFPTDSETLPRGTTISDEIISVQGGRPSSHWFLSERLRNASARHHI